ncbi:DUF3127-containing protein [Aureococcus anophagefferens]|nr:DUF3127-containing protein [Aureococcus anophagefferens]
MALLLAARSARCFVARAPAVRPPSARAMSSSGSYDMEGTISKIGEVQTFESGFAKIEFVVTTEEMYPQEVNEWQGRHYVNLQAWRLQNLAAGGGDGYASPPVASSGGASASPFDAPFSSFTADPPRGRRRRAEEGRRALLGS